MRIAVLGCGSIGRRHLRNLNTLGQTDLIAFDPALPAREAVREELGSKCHASLDDVWSQKPDVVVVATPTHLHLELAQAATLHGCHLFIEKPLSHSLDGTDALLSSAGSRGLITMVGCNMRFHPGPALVKRLIGDEAAGEIISARIQTGSYLPEWRPRVNYRDSYSANAMQGGGAILDCIHEVDLSLWYFGPGALIAAAIQPAKSLGLGVDGLAEILVRHQSGVLANIHLNFVQRDYRRTCQIIGEKGTIYWDFEHPSVELRKGGSLIQRFALAADWEMNQMYLDELSYFLSCVETRKPTFCGLEDGLAALRIALDAKEQAEAAWTRKARKPA